MKNIAIDELLSWAFVHELPKGGGVEGLDNANSAWRMLMASSWGKITDWAALMASIDTGARDYDNFLLEQGAPHDDALLVGECVAELVDCGISIPADWQPLTDWASGDAQFVYLTAKSIGQAVERFNLRTPARRTAHLISLVVGTAVLGREPQWDAPEPSVRMVQKAGKPAWFMQRAVKDVFGKESLIEVDGYDAKAGRQRPGAYRRYEFSVDPVGDVMSRLDRQLWAVALEHLQSRLESRLAGRRLSNFDISLAPWGYGGQPIQLIAQQDFAIKKSA